KDEVLKVELGPLPWPGHRRLEVSNIFRLYCEKSGWRNNNHTAFLVFAVLTDDSTLRLLSNVNEGQARFFKQQLDDWLSLPRYGVPHEPVALRAYIEDWVDDPVENRAC